MKEKSVIIIKFGGDVISDKSRPFSINSEIIKQLISEIQEYKQNYDCNIIVVHGGGSFGHPLAKKYSIQSGIKTNIPNQIKGLIETHDAMLKLNQLIVNEFSNHKLLNLSLHPVSLFFHDNSELKFTGSNQIKILLELGIIPILFGDILLHDPLNHSIISGDRIISKICESSLNPLIQKVIFLITEDGILRDCSDSKSLIEKVPYGNNIEDVAVSNNFKIDITGGMKKKIKEISCITENHVSVDIINGNKKGNLFKELSNRLLIKTEFLTK